MLSILTSSLGRYLLKSYSCHTVETGEEVITQLILPKLDTDVERKLKKLAQNIIQKQRDNPQYQYYLYEQKEINVVIYQIYGLSEEDIREVELWYCRRYSRLAEAQGAIDEVKQKYGDYLAQCDSLADSRTGKENFIMDRTISPEDLN